MLAEGFTTHTFVQKGIYNMIFESIKKLVTYGLESGLIEESDRVYTTNRLLEALDLRFQPLDLVLDPVPDAGN